jgi:hypothetical protein
LVAGETVIAAVVCVLLHVYVVPPEAVSVALAPLQMVTVAGVIVAIGAALTVTKRVAVAVQLLALVTVTV